MTHESEQSSLSLVDLIGSAIGAILLLLIATLANQASMGGAPEAFALLTIEMKYPVNANLHGSRLSLDGRELGQIQADLFVPSAETLSGPPARAGSWDADDGLQSIALFTEVPVAVKVWTVRLLLRNRRQAVSGILRLNYTAQSRPTECNARMLNSDIEDSTPIEFQLSIGSTGVQVEFSPAGLSSQPLNDTP